MLHFACGAWEEDVWSEEGLVVRDYISIVSFFFDCTKFFSVSELVRCTISADLKKRNMSLGLCVVDTEHIYLWIFSAPIFFLLLLICPISIWWFCFVICGFSGIFQSCHLAKKNSERIPLMVVKQFSTTKEYFLQCF